MTALTFAGAVADRNEEEDFVASFVHELCSVGCNINSHWVKLRNKAAWNVPKPWFPLGLRTRSPSAARASPSRKPGYPDRLLIVNRVLVQALTRGGGAQPLDEARTDALRHFTDQLFPIRATGGLRIKAN